MSRGVVVAMLLLDGRDVVLPFEVPSVFGWMTVQLVLPQIQESLHLRPSSILMKPARVLAQNFLYTISMN